MCRKQLSVSETGNLNFRQKTPSPISVKRRKKQLLEKRRMRRTLDESVCYPYPLT